LYTAGSIITLVQVFFAIIIGLYFWNLLKSQQGSKVAVKKESRKEMEKLESLRKIKLTEPLSERTRPTSFEEIIGQEQGLKGLKAALCGPNPQHVIVYGPPGIGKTAAARLVLEVAKKNALSPFKEDAKFIEIDANTARFDERGIADPLIGSVHDPIYQGAGPMGVAGIPQPKLGAVTKAHGGVLFIDEIGELHPVQMNKLLKVLEDRKVFLESAYYSPEDPNVPTHIKEMFDKGLPADFRLVGATTRQPDTIPPAIRSRCLEVFFRPLLPPEVRKIAENAARKIGLPISEGGLKVIEKYATNGREAVNIVQIAAGLAMDEGKGEIKTDYIEWVMSSGQYSPRPESEMPPEPQVGLATGLAVYGPNQGVLLEVEVAAIRGAHGEGKIVVTGAVDEEEMGNNQGRTLRRKSMAKGSIDNVITVLRGTLDSDPRDYDIHINFPGGMPVDGPSAGITIAVAIYSAISGKPVSNEVAMTGELSLRGLVKPVGGIVPKVEAAKLAGAKKVLIPKDNWQEMFNALEGLQVVPVVSLQEAIEESLAAKADITKAKQPIFKPLLEYAVPAQASLPEGDC